jgi:hypothetical protein
MMDNDDGVGGELAARGTAARVADADEVAAAYAAIGESGERTLTLFELDVDEAVTTEYVGERTERRRWRASD